MGDIALFLAGGLVVYGLVYFFGFVTLGLGLYALWYLMMIFFIVTATAIAPIIAAGLSMIVTPPTRV